MNRFQIRNQVRRILRDNDYPKTDIDDAINSVIQRLNGMGRFKFHQGSQAITLVLNTSAYEMTVTQEELVVYRAKTSEEAIIRKAVDLVSPFADGWFVETGCPPTRYALWEEQIWFDPVPNATAAGKIVTIYGWTDVASLTSDTATPAIPSRFHVPVLAYGAAAEINPTLVIEQGNRAVSIANIFNESLRDMLVDQTYDPLKSHSLLLDDRWSGLSTMGYISRVR